MVNLDHIDRSLLALLAKDPRSTAVTLSASLGLSRNTVQARMAKLERSGVFLPYERSFSPRALGFPLQAFISIWVQQNRLPEIVNELARLPEVVQAFGLSGTVDFVALVACRDTDHLFQLDARILAIDGIERAETALVMNEVIPFRIMGLATAQPEG